MPIRPSLLVRMWRRPRLSLLNVAVIVVVTATLLPTVQPHADVEAQQRRPNIIIIQTDDQRADLATMPKTRQYFHAEGRRYPNAVATTPLCCPSRASTMTGYYAHNHGLLQNGVYQPDFRYEDMMQAHLQAGGYETALYGKYLNAWGVRDAVNFDDYAVLGDGSYYGTPFNINGTVTEIPQHSTEFIADKAVDFIQRPHDKPWMMYVTPFSPHDPYTPEPAYANAKVPAYRPNPAMAEGASKGKPAWVNRGQSWDVMGRETRIAQQRSLMTVDDLVTSVTGALRRSAQEDNTLVIYMSDNAYLWGEYGFTGKGVPYTPGVIIPFYARWPGRIPAGSVDHRMVANIDLVPTILNLAGIDPGERDGNDLLDDTWSRNRILLEYWCNIKVCKRWASTRTATAQYIEHYTAQGDVYFREFYDLRKDPWQLNNLLRDASTANDPNVTYWSKRLARDKACTGVRCP